MLYSPVVFVEGTSDVQSKAMCSIPLFYRISPHVLNKLFYCLVVGNCPVLNTSVHPPAMW